MTLSRDITGTIGGTPLVFLRRIPDTTGARVAVKLESRNPGGSVKDRIALAMIEAAEAEDLITPGATTLVEPTSGNTGIALAMIGASKGYQVTLTMPESMSVERRRLLAAFGATMVLTPAGEGMQGAVEAAEEILADDDSALSPGQFTNPANPRMHHRTTGPEIDEALGDLELGAFVAGVGTGGTVSGVGRFMREARSEARIVAVEPAESPIIAQRLRGEQLTPGPHLIQGIGANFVPDNLDLEVLDEVIAVPSQDALVMGRRLAAEEGILAGISSGANVCAALEVASRPEMAGRVVVTVVCSTGERYLSTALFEALES